MTTIEEKARDFSHFKDTEKIMPEIIVTKIINDEED